MTLKFPGYSSKILPRFLTLPKLLQLRSPNHKEKKKNKKKATQEAARQRRIDTKYDALPETQQIEVADGYINFCCTFKYLGPCISYNL